MSSRIISPPREDWDNLPTQLTPGERRVAEFFDEHLPEGWEIYVQPHLNGLRPDFVLLNPQIGIAVFEVKDWDLDAIEHRAEPNNKGQLPRLMARDSGGKTFSRETENPVSKVRRYKNEIYNLYCPSLPERKGFGTITAGIIFTQTPHDRIQRLLEKFNDDDERKYRNLYPIAGRDDIASGDIRRLFPNCNRYPDSRMSEERASSLRGWLKEPAYSREQREPLELNERQRELATTRTVGGYRRVKGPAGSGKSLALAARAAELADAGANVLVVCFNITLMNYLRDLTVRHRTQRRVIKRQVDFLHFHGWCKRVCEDSAHTEDYYALWKEYTQDEVLDCQMANLVQEAYTTAQGGGGVPYYDAILVDEGQDFNLLWWNTLRKALRQGGEMLLVADKTQNIYGRASAWTDEAMRGAGFPGGPWFTLETVYRLPRDIMPFLHEYADTFLTDEEVDIPEQIPLSGPADLRWVQIDSTENAVDVCVKETRRQQKNLYPDTAHPDIIFITQRDEIGRAFVEKFQQYNVNVLHTFDKDEGRSRRQKLAFWQGSPKLKATTLHSFKGWEARHLVVYVESIDKPEDRALFYAALTRLKQHENGSTLTVVSSCPQLREFGRDWPDFEEPNGIPQSPRKGIMAAMRVASRPHLPQRIKSTREPLGQMKQGENKGQRENANLGSTYGFKRQQSVNVPEETNLSRHIAAGSRVTLRDFGGGIVQWISKNKTRVKLDRGPCVDVETSLLEC